MNITEELERQFAGNPSGLWAETKRVEAEMIRLRHIAFATLWREGKELREIASALGISESNCGGLSVRARKALGKDLVPHRNANPKAPEITASRVDFLRENANKLTQAECARCLNISPPSVLNLYKRYLPDIKHKRGRKKAAKT
jgi:hypothetical protein